MKINFNLTILLFSILTYSQEKPNFFGGFESNAQWYLNDKALKVGQPESPVRSNNYLFLNAKFKKFSAGIQIESYENKALLNFNPGYKNTNVATYFLQYQNKKIDLTAGYFYEQFGSGLLFRGWEDRALGINNALRGGRMIFKPTTFLTFKAIYGQQRSVLTDILGDKILDNTSAGTILNKQFSINLPINILNPNKISLAAFILDEKNTSINARDAKINEIQDFEVN